MNEKKCCRGTALDVQTFLPVVEKLQITEHLCTETPRLLPLPSTRAVQFQHPTDHSIPTEAK